MTTTAEAFKEAWDEQVKDRRQRSPSFQESDYTATGRAGKEFGGKRNRDWWLLNGPTMVDKYIADRKERPWPLAEIDGQPGVELELNFTLPDHDLPIKGFIDRVHVLPSGELAVVDLKTGRLPETAEQLGLYSVGLEIQHGIPVPWGYWWNPDKGYVGPFDLTSWTAERFSLMFKQAIDAVNAGFFLPAPANSCRNWCGVSRYCAAVGGELAKGNDPLAV